MQGHEEVALILMEAGADFQLPEGTKPESLPPLAQAALLFCEDFGFESHLKRTQCRDAATWTKEDGVLDVISSDSEVSDEEETSLVGDKKSLGKWFRPLDQRSSYSLKSKSRGGSSAGGLGRGGGSLTEDSKDSAGRGSGGGSGNGGSDGRYERSMRIGELAFGSLDVTPVGSAPNTARSDSGVQVNMDEMSSIHMDGGGGGATLDAPTGKERLGWFRRGKERK